MTFRKISLIVFICSCIFSAGIYFYRAKQFNKLPIAKISDQAIEYEVSINSASLHELENLPGIGPKLAKRVIEYRRSNGDFKTLSELNNVSGLGDKKFEQIKNYIKL